MTEHVISYYINLPQLRETTWTTTTALQKNLYATRSDLQGTISFIIIDELDVYSTNERNEQEEDSNPIFPNNNNNNNYN